MKIQTIKIQNFKCLGPNEIEVDFSEDILVLIGENNVGKSAFLSALYYYFSGGKTIPVEFFYNKKCDIKNAITITITFRDLTTKDKEHKAISSRLTTNNGIDTWTLEKKYYYDMGVNKFNYTTIVNGERKSNAGGLSQVCDDLFTYEKMQKIYVKAIDDVKGVSGGAGKNPFGQIFNLILKKPLEQADEYKNLINALKKYQKLFQGKQQHEKIKETEETINQKLLRIIQAKSKIVADPPKEDKILPIPKLLTNDNRDIDVFPPDQGHGFQRVIIFTLLEILAEITSPIDKDLGTTNLLLIEEPEIYMHPQMERKIADTLYEIASSGKAQVICTTHSPIFIRVADKHKALVRLIRKADNSLEIVQKKDEIFTGKNLADKKKRIRMITNFDPSVNEAFFAQRVVLVEGDSEVAVFREAAELLNYFEDEQSRHKKRDTTFINCRGKGNILAFQEVLNHFKINYVVIHDLDEKDEAEDLNGDILKLLSNKKQRMTFSKNMDKHLGIPDAGKYKPINAINRIYELHTSNKLENSMGKYIKFAYNI